MRVPLLSSWRVLATLAVPLLLYVATNLVGVSFRNQFALQVPLPGLDVNAGQAIRLPVPSACQ